MVEQTENIVGMRKKLKAQAEHVRRLEQRIRDLKQTAPQQEQSGLDPHEIAQRIREALDRQACPNSWMVIAYEAAVAALSAQGVPQ